jgi:hypothetical protein
LESRHAFNQDAINGRVMIAFSHTSEACMRLSAIGQFWMVVSFRLSPVTTLLHIQINLDSIRCRNNWRSNGSCWECALVRGMFERASVHHTHSFNRALGISIAFAGSTEPCRIVWEIREHFNCICQLRGMSRSLVSCNISFISGFICITISI